MTLPSTRTRNPEGFLGARWHVKSRDSVCVFGIRRSVLDDVRTPSKHTVPKFHVFSASPS